MRYNNSMVDCLRSFEGRFKLICKDLEAATEAAPAKELSLHARSCGLPVTVVSVAASRPASENS
jgi:hypothetical protein